MNYKVFAAGLIVFITGIALSTINPYFGILGIIGGGIMGLQSTRAVNLNRSQAKVLLIFLASLVTVMIGIYILIITYL